MYITSITDFLYIHNIDIYFNYYICVIIISLNYIYNKKLKN